MTTLIAPLQSSIVGWCVQPQQAFAKGDVVVILEAMKMEHEVRAVCDGIAQELFYKTGETVEKGAVLMRFEVLQEAALHKPKSQIPPQNPSQDPTQTTSQTLRQDLLQLLARIAMTLDAARPQAIAKRHAQQQMSAREIVSALCDLDTLPHNFTEYGALAVAAQATRRSQEDLVANTPADGMVTGVGRINATLLQTSAPSTRVDEGVNTHAAILVYDATVLAGTQGMRNHQKTDRLLQLAQKNKLPVVLWAEGGGGRPGDVDMPIVAGLHVGTFAALAKLNGRVPLVGITSGRCFAGNAALLGCCDVVIATQNSNIGMGGPAMIEGGGLGVFKPEEVGPATVQHSNGVIDILVADDAAAVHAAKQYLAYFQGRVSIWQAQDQTALQSAIPENRLRVYDSRFVMQTLVDSDSLLEFRTGFGAGIHTALARIEGRAVGLLANNPVHLGGAIDADAADKAARFIQLCNAHGLPLISLVDTPGFMVGPEIETRAQVRHVSRMFVASGHLRVPFLSVVLRKGYGLGAMAMTAGGFHEPDAICAWPTGEFGAMGLEGAVRLGYRKELAAVADTHARQQLFEKLVAKAYADGSAINMAQTLEIDAVIDPSHTREWLVQGLASAKVRPALAPLPIDTW